MSRRARTRAKVVYVWGAMSNTEPPDDALEGGDDTNGMGWDDDYGPPELLDDSSASVEYERMLDARASQ
jgi:hypothetical protein